MSRTPVSSHHPSSSHVSRAPPQDHSASAVGLCCHRQRSPVIVPDVAELLKVYVDLLRLGLENHRPDCGHQLHRWYTGLDLVPPTETFGVSQSMERTMYTPSELPMAITSLAEPAGHGLAVQSAVSTPPSIE
ncbi:hypothetical protein KCU65_g286, partial [Aureobasidium melanogenum]